jgi:uncharacterized glyoxalase superfamily protein PhnB
MTPELNAIGIVVADMSASLSFYRLLGIEFAADAEQAPHVEVTLAGGMRLMWDTEALIKSFTPDFTPPVPEAGRVSLAFGCGDPAGVDAAYRRMVEAGHTGLLEPWDTQWGQRYGIVADPDGNSIDLYAPLG